MISQLVVSAFITEDVSIFSLSRDARTGGGQGGVTQLWQNLSLGLWALQGRNRLANQVPPPTLKPFPRSWLWLSSKDVRIDTTYHCVVTTTVSCHQAVSRLPVISVFPSVVSCNQFIRNLVSLSLALPVKWPKDENDVHCTHTVKKKWLNSNWTDWLIASRKV